MAAGGGGEVGGSGGQQERDVEIQAAILKMVDPAVKAVDAYLAMYKPCGPDFNYWLSPKSDADEVGEWRRFKDDDAGRSRALCLKQALLDIKLITKKGDENETKRQRARTGLIALYATLTGRLEKHNMTYAKLQRAVQHVFTHGVPPKAAKEIFTVGYSDLFGVWDRGTEAGVFSRFRDDRVTDDFVSYLQAQCETITGALTIDGLNAAADRFSAYIAGNGKHVTRELVTSVTPGLDLSMMVAPRAETYENGWDFESNQPKASRGHAPTP